MKYNELKQKLKNLNKNYQIVTIGKSLFGNEIFAVERVINRTLPTAILVGAMHAREHITASLLVKMLEDDLFSEIHNFNVVVVPITNPDGVILETEGLLQVPEKYRKSLIKINGNSTDFSMWKANGRGVDINNNFDANFGTNVHSSTFSSHGYIGEKSESEPETRVLVQYTKKLNTFLALSYHSKGEEIYYNFFQNSNELERDTAIAQRFAKSTGYKIVNVEKSSSGGYKDWCVQKLKIPSLTIEVGSDDLSHPVLDTHLDEIFERHKNIAKDLEFAYNVFSKFKEKNNEL